MANQKFFNRSDAASKLKIQYSLPILEGTSAYTASGLITKDNSLIMDAELIQRGDLTHLTDLRLALGVSAKRSVQAIAYAATITPNIANGTIINVGTLTGTLTVAAPTGTPTDGQELTFRIVQDGTGHAITWNSAFAFSTENPSTNIPATASAKSEADFRWNATDSKWRANRINHGF